MDSPTPPMHTPRSRPIAGSALQVTAHRGLDGFLALRSAWERNTRSDTRYWMRFAFYEQMVRDLPGGSEQVTTWAVADAGGQVRAIVPVRPVSVMIRRVPFRGVELLGGTFDPVLYQASSSDFPVESSELAADSLRAVVRALRAQPKPPAVLLLGRTTAGSHALTAALAVQQRATSHAVHGGAKWLSVDHPFEAVLAPLAKKFRASLRKGHRDLAALGTLEFGTTTRESPDFDEAFASFLEIEASGWKGTSGTATGLLVNEHDDQRRFLETIARRTDCAPIEVHWMKLDGRHVASQLWMREGTTRVVFKVGYREEYARFQPGHLLLEYVLRTSCEDPDLRTVDFLSDGGWFDKWRAEFMPWHYHYIPVSRIRGALAGGLLALPSIAQLRGLLPWHRRRLHEGVSEHARPAA